MKGEDDRDGLSHGDLVAGYRTEIGGEVHAGAMSFLCGLDEIGIGLSIEAQKARIVPLHEPDHGGAMAASSRARERA